MTTDAAEPVALRNFKEPNQLKDFFTWAAREDYDREEAMGGIATVTDLSGIEETIKDHLIKH